MKIVMIPLVAASLAGCTLLAPATAPTAPKPDAAPAAAPPPPPANARTVEQFDTTTAEARKAAATPSSGGKRLGTTVASLGDPSRPGFWIMTELVSAEGAGRIEYPQKGTSAEVTLLPAEGGSSRVSLAALRLLEAPLTDLSELVVYAR
ncbi:MAG: hypothetical protein OIF48_10040 [Silicimonas sp.]|nr:hypothetical protein [Silicimonas sp.]